jgi:hypothetical protein
MSGLNEGDLIYKLGDMVSKLGFLPTGHILRAERETNSDETDTYTYLSGLSENLFHLLRYCKARTTSYEEDRVYAIIQVFDFRLGKSAPNANRTDFTFDELNVQLHDALIYKYLQQNLAITIPDIAISLVIRYGNKVPYFFSPRLTISLVLRLS